MKYVVCPKLFELCLAEKALFTNFLINFVQANDSKLIVDKDMDVLRRYAGLNDPNGFYGFWLSLAEASSHLVFYKTSLSGIDGFDDSSAMVALATSYERERNLAVVDEDDYSSKANEIKSVGIRLVPAHEVVEDIKRPPFAKFDSDQLLRDLIDRAKTFLEKKHFKKLEDIYNDDFSEYLRARRYNVCDQTRSGVSQGGAGPGEIDIMIRSASNTGAPESIIESFILDSCGPKNTVISEHLNKLISKYDTAGLGRNFVLVFSGLSDFSVAWDNYCLYVSDLNNKQGFTSRHKLQSFQDVSSLWSDVVNVKVGLAVHLRENVGVEVFHIFINMNKSD